MPDDKVIGQFEQIMNKSIETYDSVHKKEENSLYHVYEEIMNLTKRSGWKNPNDYLEHSHKENYGHLKNMAERILRSLEFSIKLANMIKVSESNFEIFFKKLTEHIQKTNPKMLKKNHDMEKAIKRIRLMTRDFKRNEQAFFKDLLSCYIYWKYVYDNNLLPEYSFSKRKALFFIKRKVNLRQYGLDSLFERILDDLNIKIYVDDLNQFNNDNIRHPLNHMIRLYEHLEKIAENTFDKAHIFFHLIDHDQGLITSWS